MFTSLQLPQTSDLGWGERIAHGYLQGTVHWAEHQNYRNQRTWYYTCYSSCSFLQKQTVLVYKYNDKGVWRSWGGAPGIHNFSSIFRPSKNVRRMRKRAKYFFFSLSTVVFTFSACQLVHSACVWRSLAFGYHNQN